MKQKKTELQLSRENKGREKKKNINPREGKWNDILQIQMNNPGFVKYFIDSNDTGINNSFLLQWIISLVENTSILMTILLSFLYKVKKN